MPKISTYTTVTPQGNDKIIVTQTSGTPTDVTKNITIDGLKTFIKGIFPFLFNTTSLTGIQSSGNTASGNRSIAIGESTTASGISSTAMGVETAASGNHSTAMGESTIASGDTSTATGQSTTASGNISTAMGESTTASGISSTAMGENTTASGTSSTAMGVDTAASGSHSTAMGESTTASGTSSTAMGNETEAVGASSTAMGESTTASGDYSTVMGQNTTASGESSTAMGQYNVLNTGDNPTSYDATNTAFSVGNGTSEGSRSDAFKVLFNGTTTIAGSLTSESLNVPALNTAPASATSAGTLGSIRFTADYIYVCVATNTWKRVAVVTF